MQAAQVLFDRCVASGPIIGRCSTTYIFGLALNSAYSFGVGGDGVGCLFVAPTTSDLVAVYFFANGKTGSPGSLTIELRNAVSTAQPGSTLHASMTVAAPSAANQWVGVTFGTPYGCQRNALYVICVGAPSGSGADYAAICYRSAVYYDRSSYFALRASTTVNGFVSANGQATTMPILLEFADGTLLGCPYTTLASWPSTSRERGIYITGLDEDTCLTAIMRAYSTAVDGLKVYDGSAAPGATPLATFSCNPTMNYGWLDYRFRRKREYRVVFTFSGTSTVPGYFEIEDSTDDLEACGFGAGKIIATIDDGAGGWTDYADRWPLMALLIGSTPQISRVQNHDLVMGGGL